MPGIFLRNFHFRNEYKNEFEDDNEKICIYFRNRVSHKINFEAIWTRESNPTAWELSLDENVKYQDAHKNVEQINDDQAGSFCIVLTFRECIFNY